MVMECRGGELIVRIVSAFRAPSHPVYRLMVLDGDGYSEYDVDGIAQEIGSFRASASAPRPRRQNSKEGGVMV